MIHTKKISITKFTISAPDFNVVCILLFTTQFPFPKLNRLVFILFLHYNLKVVNLGVLGDNKLYEVLIETLQRENTTSATLIHQLDTKSNKHIVQF